MEWISVDDRLPTAGTDVLVFRPQVLTDDYTDKPIRVARYDGKWFSCWHQPTMWASIIMPKGWSEELSRRQRGASK